jgi:hypothetical protein
LRAKALLPEDRGIPAMKTTKASFIIVRYLRGPLLMGIPVVGTHSKNLNWMNTAMKLIPNCLHLRLPQALRSEPNRIVAGRQELA